MKEALPSHIKIEDVEIWFQDETRVGQQGSITRTWFYKGKRPRLVRQQQFLNSYIFGAVCPNRDLACGFISPYVNDIAMQIHLDLISKEIKTHAAIVMDKAGWHRSKQLKIPNNITILFLPPYSPELNPKENFWQQLKSKELSNRVYNSVEDIMDAACTAWNNFTGVKGNVRNLCYRKWADIDLVI